jgi:hypothetical protein
MTAFKLLSMTAALLAGVFAGPRTADHPCAADSPDVAPFTARIRGIVSESPGDLYARQNRIADSLPLLAANTVQMEKHKSVCRRALTAVNAARRELRPGIGDSATSVLVLKAGPVYVVLDPNRRGEEWASAYVFDLDFARLKKVFLF